MSTNIIDFKQYCLKNNFAFEKGSGNDFFDEMNLKKANFSYSVLNGAVFYKCNLTGSSFEGAELKNVIFHECNLSHVDFTNADLENVEIREDCVIFKTILTKADIRGLKLPNKIGNIIDATDKIAREIGIAEPIPRYA